MITALISRLIILVFGTLYPAYASYKAVKTKDVKEYVKWMMYWIVFAFFVTIETFTDVLLSFWFPFYYEIKVFTVLWLLSPATKGSSLLYRNFVHPLFLKREKDIDEMLVRAKERGYNTVLSLGTKGVSYATNVIIQTAMKGGGGLVEQILRKSYSLTDLSPPVQGVDITDSHSVAVRQTVRKRHGITGSASNLMMTFPEMDVTIMPENIANDTVPDIRSIEDISSGYSSTDQLYSEGVLTRSSSIASTRSVRRGTRIHLPRKTPVPEDSDESEDDFDTPILFLPDEITPPHSAPSPVPTSTGHDTLTVFEFKKSPSECSIQSHASDTSVGSSSCDPERRGKYRKRPAPKPPVLEKCLANESLDSKTANESMNSCAPRKSGSSLETTIF